MTEYQDKKQELASRSLNILSRAEKEKDVRDILIEHANMPNPNGKTNLEAVLNAFTDLATNADSEQVRSQTSIQYLKFLAKNEEEKGNKGNQPLNLQININPVKAETTIE
jgi:predicted hydrolase (HD superfamily)